MITRSWIRIWTSIFVSIKRMSIAIEFGKTSNLSILISRTTLALDRSAFSDKILSLYLWATMSLHNISYSGRTHFTRPLILSSVTLAFVRLKNRMRWPCTLTLIFHKITLYLTWSNNRKKAFFLALRRRKKFQIDANKKMHTRKTKKSSKILRWASIKPLKITNKPWHSKNTKNSAKKTRSTFTKRKTRLKS